jgi:hypothetical protein
LLKLQEVTFHKTLAGENTTKKTHMMKPTLLQVKPVVVNLARCSCPPFGNSRFVPKMPENGYRSRQRLTIYKEIKVKFSRQGLFQGEITFPMTISYLATV